MNYKTITTLLLVLCISFCNAQVSTFYTIDSCRKPQFKIEYTVPLSSQRLDLVAHPLGYIIGLPNTGTLSIDINDSTQYRYYSSKNELDTHFWMNKAEISGGFGKYDIWKERYYALLKLRDYGYFRIPIHNRHKFKKAEKEYRELMK